jgi:hypothetical protein
MTKKTHPDEHLVASIVNDFRIRYKDYPTLTKITACFNICIGLFRLCCVCGDKKDVTKLANQFHRKLLKEIERFGEIDGK